MLQFDTETSGPVLQYQMLEGLPGREKGINGVVCRAIVFLFCTNTGSWRDILHLKLYRLQVLSPEKRNSNCVSYSHCFCNLRFVQWKGNRGFRNHCAIETLGRVLNCVILTFLSNLFTPLSTTSSTDDRVSSQQLSQLPTPVQSQSLLYYLIRSTSISSIVRSWLMSIRVCLCVCVT